jgi:hypothetical protein
VNSKNVDGLLFFFRSMTSCGFVSVGGTFESCIDLTFSLSELDPSRLDLLKIIKHLGFLKMDLL